MQPSHLCVCGIVFALVTRTDALSGRVSSDLWSYGPAKGGPLAWPDTFEECGGLKQSPIDIRPGRTEAKEFPVFTFTDYDKEYTALKLFNNGHSAGVTFGEGEFEPSISGGDLPEGATFKLAQFNFHWGSDNSQGSEHQVDGEAFPGEMHMVHYNTKYANLNEALDKSPDGLAVLGFFIDVGEENAEFQKIFDKMGEITNRDQSTPTLDTIKLEDLLPADLSTFYRYMGSLTTPACHESVTWSVFQSAIKLSNTQIEKFRTLKSDTEGKIDLAFNFRPPQVIGDRTVYSVKTKSSSHATRLMLHHQIMLTVILPMVAYLW